ncbi:MAG: Uma2 family endonuclease [Chloroflexia bacterium]|nr:Uma2 family endonuclease [Chloroflexia bacterium]
MMATTTTLMTARDLELMPDDGYRYELMRGVLKKMPPTAAPHLIVSGRLIGYLNQYLEEHDLGDAGGEGRLIFENDPGVVLSPDVAVLFVEQLPELSTSGLMRVVPPLVAEVISPANRPTAIEEKVRVYLRAGVKLVWVVDTDQRMIRVRTADGGDRLLTERDELPGEDVFPEFRVELRRVFRRMLQFGRKV